MKCILVNEQPTFFKTIEDKETGLIATIKAKTRADEAELEERAMKWRVIDGKLQPSQNYTKYLIIRIRQALSGHDKCGWNIDKHKPTEDVIERLPDEIFSALANAIIEHDNRWDKNKDKNLKN